ncbi:MAG: DNA polymerase IV [Deltaproteobacteria bacterium]|nr:MAG: DNA polymerase IV [Deltaproteobacteria bacterium]
MILHLDMDAFFAAVEQRDRPELRGKPVVIGRNSPRGVVSTASYEARAYGIHSAMPIFQARKRCPDAIYVTPRMAHYAGISRQVMACLARYSPLVEPISIDEAYVDITGTKDLFGPPEMLARSIKRDILSQVGLTASIGIAPLKFLAKIASDLQKPDGLTLIRPSDVDAFIRDLPIQKVPGVGKRARVRFRRMGIRTLGEMRALSPDLVEKHFGKPGKRLLMLANGQDDRRVSPGSATQSISSEDTLSSDISDLDTLKRILLHQAEDVGWRLRKLGARGKTVQIKVKYDDFSIHTRSITLPEPVCTTESLHHAAVALLTRFSPQQPVRLIGLGISGLIFTTAGCQGVLFPEPERQREQRWQPVDQTADAIISRFGKGAIQRASLVSADWPDKR